MGSFLEWFIFPGSKACSAGVLFSLDFWLSLLKCCIKVCIAIFPTFSFLFVESCNSFQYSLLLFFF